MMVARKLFQMVDGKNHNGRHLRYLRKTFLAKNQSSAFKDCPSDDCFPEPSQFIAMNKNNLAQSSTPKKDTQLDDPCYSYLDFCMEQTHIVQLCTTGP